MERGVRSAVRLLHRLNTVMDGAARIIGFAVRSRLLPSREKDAYRWLVRDVTLRRRVR